MWSQSKCLVNSDIALLVNDSLLNLRVLIFSSSQGIVSLMKPAIPFHSYGQSSCYRGRAILNS